MQKLSMVWLKHVARKYVYVCDLCGLGYDNAVTALSCEMFCKENHACSPEIAKSAVYRP